MFLIVGLGNPGRKYQGSRHNAGFALLDALADQYTIPLTKKKWDAQVGQGRIGNDRVILMKPQTYMNNSGQAVGACAHFFKLDPSQVLVVLDDVDLEFGRIRLRTHGSAGTHNGLKSVTQALGAQNFPRLKLSVGRDPRVEDLASWVLGRFSPEEEKIFNEEVEAGLDVVSLVLDGDLDRAMNTYNSWQAPSAEAYLKKMEEKLQNK